MQRPNFYNTNLRRIDSNRIERRTREQLKTLDFSYNQIEEIDRSEFI